MPIDEIRIERLTGERLTASIIALSDLRLQVFREWPYLYEGDAVYERDYLTTFAASADAILVGAFEGRNLIGAATASPLRGHTEHFASLFEAHGFDPDQIFYCGESVLLTQWRGRGIGHRFFDERENHARELNRKGANFRYVTFCGVIRSDDDPRRPGDYRSLEAFWSKRGYKPAKDLIGTYAWREIGASEETTKQMQFWMMELS